MDDRTRHIPVLGVTGFGNAWREAALEAGCDIMLAKPTAPDDFEASVERLAAKSRRGHRARSKEQLQRWFDRNGGTWSKHRIDGGWEVAATARGLTRRERCMDDDPTQTVDPALCAAIDSLIDELGPQSGR
jgi:hypothetical protein